MWATKDALNLDKEMIMLITKMDSYSLFQDYTSGADNGFSGLITIMAVASALQTVDSSLLTHQIGFGLFQGESYGNIGSRKFIDDILNFVCVNSLPAASSVNPLKRDMCLAPLKLSTTFEKLELNRIKHVIHVDQVGKTVGNTFYVHGIPDSIPSISLVKDILTTTAPQGTVQIK